MENFNKLFDNNQIITANRLALALLVVGATLIISGFFSTEQFQQFINPSAKNISGASVVPVSDLSEIIVDVSGAVKSPGVYSLKSGSRVADAITAAGGFSDDANLKYLSKNVNLSQKLTDGQKVYLPTKSETSVSTGTMTFASSGTGGGIGINSSDSKELDKLPGIGPVTAEKIINARPFSSIDELLTKKVVSKSVFDKIKDQISLN